MLKDQLMTEQQMTELIEKLYAALRIADDTVSNGGQLIQDLYEPEDDVVIQAAFDAYDAWNEPRIRAFAARVTEEQTHG